MFGLSKTNISFAMHIMHFVTGLQNALQLTYNLYQVAG